MTKTTPEAEVGETAPMKPLSREEARAKMFSAENTTRKVEGFNFLGADLEFHQPSIDDFLNLQSDESGRQWIVRMLIAFSFIKGTSEKAFDDADYDTLMQLPMSGSFTAATNVIQKLFDLKVEDKVKN